MVFGKFAENHIFCKNHIIKKKLKNIKIYGIFCGEKLMSSTKRKYALTKFACYMGYITQAVVINLAPLLFVIFKETYGVSYEMLARIVLVNFAVQIIADIISIKLSRIFSFKTLSVTAHVLSVAGLVMFAVFPLLSPRPYAGIIAATVLYAFGGGMIEVIITPIIDACDAEESGEKGPAAIAFLHSFYCWGHVLVVLLSTLFLKAFGNGLWYFLPFLWAVIPALNIFLFVFSKMPARIEEEHGISLKELFSAKFFILAALLMMTSGASEQAVAQWASLFAEKGLGVSKMTGDLLGPMCFAVSMAVIRITAGLFGNKIGARRLLMASACLCIISYCLMVFVKVPAISLIGCSLCGFSVGFMWPGVLSLSSEKIPNGGTAMFGVLAFFGDVGCSLGPWIAGIVSDMSGKHASELAALPFFSSLDADQIGLKCGIFAAIVFPLTMFVVIKSLKKSNK